MDLALAMSNVGIRTSRVANRNGVILATNMAQIIARLKVIMML
jgi:hypothetical protein